MKSRERIICLILFVFLSSIYKITPSKTEEVVQTLHNKISNDLLSIRKEYPKSQPMVYSLLDQVCKMYQISKSAMEGKKKLKNLVQTKELENKLLKGENATLKNEVDLVLHGHQHQPFLSTISKDVKNSNYPKSRTLSIHGAGSAGVQNKYLGSVGKNSYSILKFKEESIKFDIRTSSESAQGFDADRSCTCKINPDGGIQLEK